MLACSRQEMRLTLVMRCLDFYDDVDDAIAAAERMADFVEGGGSGGRHVARAASRAHHAPSPSPDRAQPAAGACGKSTRSEQPDDTLSTPPETAAVAPANDGAMAGSPAAAAPHTEKRAVPAPCSAVRGVGRGAGPKPRWDAAAEARLRAEWETDKPVDLIARELGRTPGSVRERARRLGLRRRRTAHTAAPVPVAAMHANAGERASRQARTATANRPAAQSVKRTRRGAGRSGAQAVEALERPATPTNIADYRISRPRPTFESAINFVRSRDYQVVRGQDGGVVVDGRKHLSQDEFLRWANEIRRQLRKPAFPLDLAHAS